MTAPATLASRVALVTGASRGIGRAIARRLAAHGCAVVVTASPRSDDPLRETCELIERAGGRAAHLTADLAEPAQRGALVAQATALLGPVDILINNAAAIPSYAPPSQMPAAARVTTFEINFQAPVDLIQQALPAMHSAGWGRIVNISSETAQQPPIPYPGPARFIHALAVYGASKAALDRYTLGLAAELHGSGIAVNALRPYKIALTEGARRTARAFAVTHPDWIEPVELMAEACYRLVNGSFTGLAVGSRNLLQQLQAPLHALDGHTVIGDALTAATIE